MPMKVAEFLRLVESGTLERLTDDLRDCTHRVRSVWFQVHYHSPRVHYEVWLARKIERIEIGLHFEGPRDFSYLWAERLAAHMPEIQAQLGAHVELEEWTASWARIHQTLPYGPLSEALADQVAALLARMITVLQPIVARERPSVPLELEARQPRAPQARRRWRRR